MPKIVAVRPKVEPTERSSSLLTMHEGHADRHHAVARGVAQHREQRAGGAEKRRVQIEAAQIEQRHDDEQADFPTAEQQRGSAFAPAGERRGWRWSSAVIRWDPLAPALREKVAGRETPDELRIGSWRAGPHAPSPAGGRGASAFSFRSACRPSRRCPWSRAVRACPGSPPRCCGRSADRAASRDRSPAGTAAGRASPATRPS